jgi:hypothetical protein
MTFKGTFEGKPDVLRVLFVGLVKCHESFTTLSYNHPVSEQVSLVGLTPI